MSLDPFAPRPPRIRVGEWAWGRAPHESPERPVTAPESPETTLPSLSGSPEDSEALTRALATARRELAEAHEVIERLMSQRPTAGTCGCPTGRFDAQGLCTNADCEHPVERHSSGRCDVEVGE